MVKSISYYGETTVWTTAADDQLTSPLGSLNPIVLSEMSSTDDGTEAVAVAKIVLGSEPSVAATVSAITGSASSPFVQDSATYTLDYEFEVEGPSGQVPLEILADAILGENVPSGASEQVQANVSVIGEGVNIQDGVQISYEYGSIAGILLDGNLALSGNVYSDSETAVAEAGQTYSVSISAAASASNFYQPNASAEAAANANVAISIASNFAETDEYSLVFSPPISPSNVPNDFEGSGTSDILWRNTDGDTYIWLSNGSGGFTGLDLGVVPADWQIAGTGDFSGNGLTDILWRNADGDAYIWNSNGSGGFTGLDLGIVSTDWQIAGTGDFSGNGATGILWRNADGDTYIWNANGSGGFTGLDLGVVSLDWQIASTGDFEGNGLSDILWRNTDGDTYIWNSNGSGGFTGIDLGIVPTSWQIASIGDFNGDGSADILWRNADGDTYIWNGNGAGGFTGLDLGVVPNSWTIQAR